MLFFCVHNALTTTIYSCSFCSPRRNIFPSGFSSGFFYDHPILHPPERGNGRQRHVCGGVTIVNPRRPPPIAMPLVDLQTAYIKGVTYLLAPPPQSVLWGFFYSSKYVSPFTAFISGVLEYVFCLSALLEGPR